VSRAASKVDRKVYAKASSLAACWAASRGACLVALTVEMTAASRDVRSAVLKAAYLVELKVVC